MKNDGSNGSQDHRGEESSNAPDLQTNKSTAASQNAKKKTAGSSKGDRWTLQEHWDRASSAKRVKWIFQGIGGLIAFLVLVNYVWQNLQTKWSFERVNRADIVLGNPVLHTSTDILEVPLSNIGHISSGNVLVHINEATFDLPTSPDDPSGNRMINGWGALTLQSIPPGSGLVSLNIPIPAFDIERLRNGKQFIHACIRLVYADGFSEAPKQPLTVCFQSSVIEPAREIQFLGIDPKPQIQQMEKWDENESPKYRFPSFQ